MYVDCVEDEREGRLWTALPDPSTASDPDDAAAEEDEQQTAARGAEANGRASSDASANADGSRAAGRASAAPGQEPEAEHAPSHRTCGYYMRLCMYHTSAFLPLLILVTWFKPLTDELRKHRTLAPYLQEDVVVALRLQLLLFWTLMRLMTARAFLQSYLHLAARKLMAIRREAGRITNVELRQTVAGVHYYLGVVLVHYVAPVFLVLFFAFIWKTLGQQSWFPPSLAAEFHRWGNSSAAFSQSVLGAPLMRFSEQLAAPFPESDAAARLAASLKPQDWRATISNAMPGPVAATLTEALEGGAAGELIADLMRSASRSSAQLRLLLSGPICNGLLGFLLAWLLFAYSLSFALGIVYHSLLAEARN